MLPILSLGEQYVSDFVLVEEGAKAPLNLVLCGRCSLLQLGHTFDRETLYREYWYKSGINEAMVAHLSAIAHEVEKRAKLSGGDYVIDIGANDGTLLRAYSDSIYTVGFEPAKNLAREARVGTSAIINDFFSKKGWKASVGNSKARVITAIAMFYDLEEPNAFVSDLAHCLSRDGLCVIQQNYLPAMLENNSFDNICHEHLEYYSLLSMEPLLSRHGLEVVDAEVNDLNGGSFRTYIMHQGEDDPTSAVERMRDNEAKLGLDTAEPYFEFAARVKENGEKLHDFITAEVKAGKVVYAYGPGNRGNTILQSYNLDHRLIRGAAERNPEKWGRKTVGTWIPIVSEEKARKDQPDYFLILPWAFVDTFAKREREFLNGGGQFIVPLPEFHLRGSA